MAYSHFDFEADLAILESLKVDKKRFFQVANFELFENGSAVNVLTSKGEKFENAENSSDQLKIMLKVEKQHKTVFPKFPWGWLTRSLRITYIYVILAAK